MPRIWHLVQHRFERLRAQADSFRGSNLMGIDCSDEVLGSGAFTEALDVSLCAGLGREDGMVGSVVNQLSLSEIQSRQERLNQFMDDLNALQNHSIKTSSKAKTAKRLDALPLVLSAADWEVISKGIVQRALAFNAYANDLYSDQAILKDRVIPLNLALRDPAFLRQLSNIPVVGGEYSQFGAFDLVQTQQGEWRVAEHHMGMPYGLSHVLQNRRALSQLIPEYFEALEVATVAGFSTYLLEMLRAQSSKKNPHVVLLTNGFGQGYFEESLLARSMGLSIAQPGDLLVRDSHVYLKTVRGIELIDVIFRRIDSSEMDPIAIPQSSSMGVPGLLNVWRQGNVGIVNAPGVGVADNRGLLRHSDSITRYYLRQNPILKSVETYHLGDVDQFAYIEDSFDDYRIKPIQDHNALWRRFQCGGERWNLTNKSIRRLAKKHSEYFVAQKYSDLQSVPRLADGGLSLAEGYVRVFYILGKEPIVLPGGLFRLAGQGHRSERLSIESRGLKDVLVSSACVEALEPKREPVKLGPRYSISSRVAESFYWAGRYLERAQNTARQFSTLETLRWEQLAGNEQRSYWPLLRAVATATGQEAIIKRQKLPDNDKLALSRRLLIDPQESASVRSCVNASLSSLEGVQESVSPECWEVVRELLALLEAQRLGRFARNRLQDLCKAVVGEVDRFSGTVERSMPHDDTWQFYRVGRFYERALGTITVLETALPKMLKDYRDLDEESLELTALLRLLGSLDAYRREYRSRAYVDRVARFVMLAKHVPNSVVFCLRNIHYAIGTLSLSGERVIGEEFKSEIESVISELEGLSIFQMDLETALDRDRVVKREAIITGFLKDLKGLTERFECLHELLEDLFFSHQHVFAKDPMLFEVE